MKFTDPFDRPHKQKEWVNYSRFNPIIQDHPIATKVTDEESMKRYRAKQRKLNSSNHQTSLL